MRELKNNEDNKNLGIEKQKSLIRRSLTSFYQSSMNKKVEAITKDIIDIENIKDVEFLMKKRDKIITERAKLAEKTTDLERIIGMVPRTKGNSGLLNMYDDFIEVENSVIKELTDNLYKIYEQIDNIRKVKR